MVRTAKTMSDRLPGVEPILDSLEEHDRRARAMNDPLSPRHIGGFLEALRNPWCRLLADVQHSSHIAAIGYFAGLGLKTLAFPLTTTSVTCPVALGSDSTPVPIEFQGAESYLSDSMQFFLEYGCRFFEAGCFCVQPSFRGEAPDPTHLPQFTHVEAEVPGGLDVAVTLAEGLVRHLADALLNDLGPRIHASGAGSTHLEAVASRDQGFPRIRLDEALRLVSESDVDIDPNLGFRRIRRAGERKLIQVFDGPVWLTHHDHLSVPFFQAYADHDGHTARNADLMLGLGEVVGLGERHFAPDDVRRALARHGVPLSKYEWYCRLREESPLATSGFGLGLERFFCWALQHHDIRDVRLLSSNMFR